MAHPQLNQKTVEYISIALLDCAGGFGGSTIQGVAQTGCNYNNGNYCINLIIFSESMQGTVK
jgi:hypothetical protein